MCPNWVRAAHVIDTLSPLSRDLSWQGTCCHVIGAWASRNATCRHVTQPSRMLAGVRALPGVFAGTPPACVFGGGASESLIWQLPSRHSGEPPQGRQPVMAANPPKDQTELGIPLYIYIYPTRGARVHCHGELRRNTLIVRDIPK